ncbi:MAG: hypothetical protein HZB22_08085 [Deltaproteobacteria bacterium]|nr:hypothetical protein [Deltaproteobacteria bacterium]
MKPPDNEFGERVLKLLDRKARIFEVFAIDVIAFLDKKDLLKEFVEERMKRRDKYVL